MDDTCGLSDSSLSVAVGPHWMVLSLDAVQRIVPSGQGCPFGRGKVFPLAGALAHFSAQVSRSPFQRGGFPATPLKSSGGNRTPPAQGETAAAADSQNAPAPADRPRRSQTRAYHWPTARVR